MKRKNTGFYRKWNYESQLILFSILFIIDIQIIITYNNILLTNHFTKSHETIIYKNPQRPSSATLNPNNHQKKKKLKNIYHRIPFDKTKLNKNRNAENVDDHSENSLYNKFYSD